MRSIWFAPVVPLVVLALACGPAGAGGESAAGCQPTRKRRSGPAGARG
ncbi:MAG: hypothetical protein HY329_23685 [Chloroflexi bacterium]|nr:hypothetical protein [Chloroflexota bacterium]